MKTGASASACAPRRHRQSAAYQRQRGPNSRSAAGTAQRKEAGRGSSAAEEMSPTAASRPPTFRAAMARVSMLPESYFVVRVQQCYCGYNRP